MFVLLSGFPTKILSSYSVSVAQACLRICCYGMRYRKQIEKSLHCTGVMATRSSFVICVFLVAECRGGFTWRDI
jgi:hypothetical protein